MTADLINRLEGALAPVGPAHHAAFVETDGHDPDWALWYAHHVIAELREILGQPDLTESRLVWAFVAAADAHGSQDAEVPWHEFYAEWFATELVPATE